jgi:hypothetical protein
VKDQIPKRLATVAVENDLSLDVLEFLIPATAMNAVGIPGSFATVPGITPAIEAAAAQAYKEAYAYAFTRVFYASIPFGILAIICAIFIKDPSQYLTNHTAVHMVKEVVGTTEPQHIEHSNGKYHEESKAPSSSDTDKAS